MYIIATTPSIYMFLHLLPRHYFKKDRHFYICSFGGCGSWIIAQYLSNFGQVHHIHSRKPPAPYLTTVELEHFTSIPHAEQRPQHHYVLYVYRDPVAALQSVQRRFALTDHFRMIECSDTNVTLDDIVDSQQDLIGLAEFDANYTRPSLTRKYPIYCVKYELFFSHLPEFNKALGLVDFPKLYPVKKENAEAPVQTSKALERVYAPLREAMHQRPFVFIS